MIDIWRLIPVLLLFIVLGAAAWIGFQIYLYTQTLTERGRASMEKRNIHVSRDGGMRVGVKELRNEDYADKTQSTIVKVWNLSSWPAYQSRYWNQTADINNKKKAGWWWSSSSAGDADQAALAPEQSQSRKLSPTPSRSASTTPAAAGGAVPVGGGASGSAATGVEFRPVGSRHASAR